MLQLYMLTDPLGDGFAYVGCTSNPTNRLAQHMRVQSSSGMRQWIKRLEYFHLQPNLTILDEVSNAEASQAEVDAIAMCRAIRGHLCPNAANHATGLILNKKTLFGKR